MEPYNHISSKMLHLRVVSTFSCRTNVALMSTAKTKHAKQVNQLISPWCLQYWLLVACIQHRQIVVNITPTVWIIDVSLLSISLLKTAMSKGISESGTYYMLFMSAYAPVRYRVWAQTPACIARMWAIIGCTASFLVKAGISSLSSNLQHLLKEPKKRKPRYVMVATAKGEFGT